MRKKDIKTKDYETIMYNNDFILFDANCGLKKDYATIDDTLLQDKINKNEAFFYNRKYKEFADKIPNIEKILPMDVSNFTQLIDMDLMDQYKCKIFYNQEKKYIVFFKEEYLKNLYANGIKKLYQSNKHTMAIGLDDKENIIAIVMPCYPCSVTKNNLELIVNKEIEV